MYFLPKDQTHFLKHIAEHKQANLHKAVQTVVIWIRIELSRVRSVPVHCLYNLTGNSSQQSSVVGVITSNLQRGDLRLREIT